MRATHILTPPQVKILGSVQVTAEGCWVWTGGQNGHGYGSARWEGVRRRAHRLSYEAFVGPVPDGLHLDHLCRTPACVNPTHLEPVTPAENVRRGKRGEVRPSCREGHPYAGDNLYINPSGRKVCRQCAALSWRRYYHRKKETACAEHTF